jgi:hypothetical protein
MTEQVQPQVGIGGVGRRCLEVDVDQDNLSADLASLVIDNCRDECRWGGTVIGCT